MAVVLAVPTAGAVAAAGVAVAAAVTGIAAVTGVAAAPEVYAVAGVALDPGGHGFMAAAVVVPGAAAAVFLWPNIDLRLENWAIAELALELALDIAELAFCPAAELA